MIEFRALGTVDFRGVDPTDADVLRSHPRWIATLTCLLLPTSGGAWRREGLVSLLWPSAGGTRGRSSLRVVLHGLRRHLGRDAIVSRGDELRIDPRRLTCDALVFEELLSKRRHEEALAVYAGELLPGFAVSRAPRFERWLADRRESLRLGAVSAAWARCGAAERRAQWIGAVRYARRAVSLAERSEPAVRRFLRLLHRAGDGASALREYRKFADRWRRELGVEPADETRALVEEIRRRPGRKGRRPAAAATLEPGGPLDAPTREPAPSAEEPDRPASGARRPEPPRVDQRMDPGRIVVLPLLIDGEDPGLEHLAAGMAHDVISSLARVSGITVLPRPSARYSPDAVGRGPADIGRALDADLVLDTSVRIVAERLIFVSRLTDVEVGRPIWADAYDGTRSDLLSIRQRLLQDVLAAAGIEPSAAEVERLVLGPTSSPEAFELYLEGRSRWSRRTGEEVQASIELFEEALAIDPAFALAQAGLMEAYAALHPSAGRRVSESAVVAREAGRRALELDPGLGEVHATLGLLRIFIDRDWEGAEADLRRAIAASPGHASAHHWLGAFLTYIRGEFEEGARELEIARQLDPHSPVIQAEIGLVQMNRGDLDGAHGILTEIMRNEPGFWRAPYFLGVTCFLAGDPEAGTANLRRAWRLGAFSGEAESARIEEPPAGGWRDTLQWKLTRLETSKLQPGVQAIEGALISILLGRRADAIRWLRSVPDRSSPVWIAEFFPVFEPLLEEPGFREFLVDSGMAEVFHARTR